MLKIGIITINDFDNYGNRLQNYAVQEIFLSMGHNVETINNSPNYSSSTSNRLCKLQKIKKLSIIGLGQLIKNKLFYVVKRKKHKRIITLRFSGFKKFTNEFIKNTSYTVFRDYVPEKEIGSFDFFVTGSDQIWNPHHRKGSEVDFLVFAPKHKRIAYVPSFGVAQIPPQYEASYREWISDIPHVSVREHAGAQLIKELTGREAEVFVDPTLMLTKEKWLSIAKEPKRGSKTKYLLTYFLGEPSATCMKQITQIAEANKLEIINLASLKDPAYYSADPSEFIAFIHSASLFCTDSYHGVIFSILMQTPFIVFDRSGSGPSMGSRIDTLLQLFELEHRRSNHVLSSGQYFEMDYSHVNDILARERARAYAFLKNALGQA